METNVSHWPGQKGQAPPVTTVPTICSNLLLFLAALSSSHSPPRVSIPRPSSPLLPCPGQKGKEWRVTERKALLPATQWCHPTHCHLQAPPTARGAGPPPRGAPLPCPGARTDPPPPPPPPSPAPHTPHEERDRFSDPAGPPCPPGGALPSPPREAPAPRPCRTSG